MGGGAGINFSFTLDGAEARWSKRRGLFVPSRQPEIERFDALGYDDGMRDVSGRLFRITRFAIDKPDADIDWINRRFSWRTPDCLSIDNAEHMIFRGWVRGEILEQFPMCVKAECSSGADFIGTCEFTVQPTNPEELRCWYADCFESYTVEPDDWEDHLYFRNLNYKAA